MPISAAQAPKVQMCFKNMGILWGVICHFVTQKILQFITVYHTDETFSSINSWKSWQAGGQGHSLTRKTHNQCTSHINLQLLQRIVVCTADRRHLRLISQLFSTSHQIMQNDRKTVRIKQCPYFILFFVVCNAVYVYVEAKMAEGH